jgi:hypothetical protein
MRMCQTKKNLGRLGLVIGSTLIFCILFEIFLRLREHPYINLFNTKNETVYVYSEEFHHCYRPNQVFYRIPTDQDEFSLVRNEINSLGMRGPEIKAKAPNEYRILILGDSFIEGEEVPFSKSLGQQLHKLFQKSGMDYVTVLQHGISSWSPLLELAFLQKIGLSLNPDMVIVVLENNDFGLHYQRSDYFYKSHAIFDDQGLPIKFVNLPFRDNDKRPPEQKKRKWSDFRIIELIKEARGNFIKPREEQEKFVSQKDIDYLLSIDTKILFKEMDRLIPETKYSILLKDRIRLARPVSLWDTEIPNSVDQSIKYLDKMHRGL